MPTFKKGKKEDAGKDGLVSLNLIPGKVIEQLILEKISRHTIDKTVNKSNEDCSFNKGKSFLTNFINFCVVW